MNLSYLESETDETADGLRGTTSTRPVDEPIDDEEDESPAPTPQWRRLTVTLRTSGVDALPQMTISATNPTYSVNELPVSDSGECTLWIPNTVDTLDIVLSFPTTEQDPVSVPDITISGQDTITIPIVVLTS